MNAVEIEEAVSRLAESPFDPEEFPFAFLEAFGNKPTTIKRLKSNSSNQSDRPGGVLQRNNIHLKVCAAGEVGATLTALRQSPATARQKAKFILATDGKSFEAENLADGETVACDYPNFPDHFGFFLPLAGITTVKQIRENAFDIKATGRLNRLYVELLKDNPDWDKAERREDFNHFMARLIFCFFAEDTNIFHSEGLFTNTIAQMSAGDTSNTHEVLAELFRAMCTPLKEREAAGIRSWANGFPYVNGGLFSVSHDGSVDVPRFSKMARSYLLHDMSFGNMPVDAGNLLLSAVELRELGLTLQDKQMLVRRIYGSAEFIRGLVRYCLWIEDEHLQYALSIESIQRRIDDVREMRLASKDAGTNKMAARAHQMREMNIGKKQTVSMPCVSSENRDYLPVGLIDARSTVTNLAFALYDAPLWNMALIASRLHLVWIATVCGKLETRYRYSNTLGWNTFPVPTLTEQNKADLTRCAEDILLAREHYFPATIADLYNPDRMDKEFPLVREAHDRNDEILERIYIGRRFKNDTERLEKLFELYTKMTSQQSAPKPSSNCKPKGTQQ